MPRDKRNQPYMMYERIQEQLYRKNMTAQKLADLLGVERKSAYAYKNGDTCPDALIVAKMCGVFGCSADYLIFGKE